MYSEWQLSNAIDEGLKEKYPKACITIPDDGVELELVSGA
jgi:hypothetical protein